METLAPFEKFWPQERKKESHADRNRPKQGAVILTEGPKKSYANKIAWNNIV